MALGPACRRPAAVGSGEQLTKGRGLAVSSGLTPRQHGTGGKERLLGISKRGDPYLRKRLIHAARSVIFRSKDKEDGLSRWIKGVPARRPVTVACAALANKTARMAWATIRNGTDYPPRRAVQPLGST